MLMKLLSCYEIYVNTTKGATILYFTYVEWITSVYISCFTNTG